MHAQPGVCLRIDRPMLVATAHTPTHRVLAKACPPFYPPLLPRNNTALRTSLCANTALRLVTNTALRTFLYVPPLNQHSLAHFSVCHVTNTTLRSLCAAVSVSVGAIGFIACGRNRVAVVMRSRCRGWDWTARVETLPC